MPKELYMDAKRALIYMSKEPYVDVQKSLILDTKRDLYSMPKKNPV